MIAGRVRVSLALAVDDVTTAVSVSLNVGQRAFCCEEIDANRLFHQQNSRNFDILTIFYTRKWGECVIFFPLAVLERHIGLYSLCRSVAQDRLDRRFVHWNNRWNLSAVDCKIHTHFFFHFAIFVLLVNVKIRWRAPFLDYCVVIENKPSVFSYCLAARFSKWCLLTIHACCVVNRNIPYLSYRQSAGSV